MTSFVLLLALAAAAVTNASHFVKRSDAMNAKLANALRVAAPCAPPAQLTWIEARRRFCISPTMTFVNIRFLTRSRTNLVVGENESQKKKKKKKSFFF
jgi:hypothetical protein